MYSEERMAVANGKQIGFSNGLIFCRLRERKIPPAGIANAARGNGHRRTRGLQSPQPAFGSPLRGDCNHRCKRNKKAIASRLIRPERPLRCQPRASPWVYDAEVDFALKGQKICVLVLLLLQSVICRGISTPRALLRSSWCSGGKAGRPWADIFLPLWGVPSPCLSHVALNADG